MAAFARSLILAALFAISTPALAQSSATPSRPSFDGVWTNASATRLERPQTFAQLVVPKVEADALETAAVERQGRQRPVRSQRRRIQGRQQPGWLQRVLDRPRLWPHEAFAARRGPHIIVEPPMARSLSRPREESRPADP